MTKRVLTVAPSDTNGSSGLEADVKTVLALGGYATTAVTSVNTRYLKKGADPVPMSPKSVTDQMRAILADIGTDAIKISYLCDTQMVDAVGDILDAQQNKGWPVVLDPMILASDRKPLVDEDAVAAWKRRLCIHAAAITIDLQEAEYLTGLKMRDIEDMRHAADMLCTLGIKSVVLKVGQQAVEDKVVYLIADSEHDDEYIFERPLIETRHTLGAGCTLSAGLAISLAQGMGIYAAVERALGFMHETILHAPRFGGHAGPINHAFDIEKTASAFYRKDIKVHKTPGKDES